MSEQSDVPYRAHATATIDSGAQIGAGSAVWHYSHVSAGARIGRGCSLGQNVYVANRVVIGDNVKIQNNVSVYDEVTLQDDVFCGPSMVFTNVVNPRSAIVRKDEYRPTLVCRGATLGANCTVVCGSTIGELALIGAGAVVTHDVPAYALMLGVPARQAGWVCRCGVTLPPRRLAEREQSAELYCAACGDGYLLQRDETLPLGAQLTARGPRS